MVCLDLTKVLYFLWMTFSIVIAMFPSTPQVDGHTMNYTVVVAGGWILLSITHYFFPKYGGRYWFNGPMSTVESEEVVEKNSFDVEEKE